MNFKYVQVDGKQAAYIDEQAPGAIKNGSRITKVKSDIGDSHDVGATGFVIGSIGPHSDEKYHNEYGYFVQWDEKKYFKPVFVMGSKIKEV